MNSKQADSPRLDPGESTLPRKRFLNLLMETTVFNEATNLLPPLDSPQQPPDSEPAQPPPAFGIGGRPFWIADGCLHGRWQQQSAKGALCTNAPKDLVRSLKAC